MERWAAFHSEDSWPKRLPKLETPVPPPPAPPPVSYEAPQPVVRQPKIGRNDSCPCGSGKKYKKGYGKG
jgi:preprotein translocase subunit SecA